MMDARSFYLALLRLDGLSLGPALAAGVKLSRLERQAFEADPIQFFLRAGETRRVQLLDIVDPTRAMPRSAEKTALSNPLPADRASLFGGYQQAAE